MYVPNVGVVIYPVYYAMVSSSVRNARKLSHFGKESGRREGGCYDKGIIMTKVKKGSRKGQERGQVSTFDKRRVSGLNN